MSSNDNDETTIKKIIIPNFVLFKNKKKIPPKNKTFQQQSNKPTEKCSKKKITSTDNWINMQQLASTSTSENNIQLFYLQNLNLFFHSITQQSSTNNDTQQSIPNNDELYFANINATNLSNQSVANNDTQYPNTKFNYGSILLNEIKKKLQGYKQQDIKKHIYCKDNFCDISTTIHLITNTHLICNYCKENMKIIYNDVKDEMQWTLDRIDNNHGHNTNNVLICCLKCNLKRRKQNMGRFHFAEKMKKQLIIQRL